MPTTGAKAATASTQPVSDKGSDKSDTSCRRSVGEELYLVHLRREQGRERSEDDFDCATPRKRAHSVGEELWDIHLKRSRGLDPDVDAEDPPSSTSPPKEVDATKEVSKGAAAEEQHKAQRCMHLRNRDVPVKGQ